MIFEYKLIYIYIISSIILTCIILLLSYFLSLKNNDIEKISPYECGFSPFEDTRYKFDVRFYLVAILFIIFDLEVSYLFPWALSISHIGLFGFWTMFVFLIILTIGFIYEWKQGALEWE